VFHYGRANLNVCRYITAFIQTRVISYEKTANSFFVYTVTFYF
jgi:hypothetical protein